jgi:hypothetical protein
MKTDRRSPFVNQSNGFDSFDPPVGYLYHTVKQLAR